MQTFLTEDFLPQTETARYLYHEHAAHFPIIDYHCHLSPKMVAENKRFNNITREGAGYAGGVTSCALDGINVALAIVRKMEEN